MIMKMAKKMILAAAVLPIALGSAAAFAAGGGKGPGQGRGLLIGEPRTNWRTYPKCVIVLKGL